MPYAVSFNPLLVRSNRGEPNSFSKRLMTLLTFGWGVNSLAAALLNLPQLWAVTRYSSRLISILTKLSKKLLIDYSIYSVEPR